MDENILYINQLLNKKRQTQEQIFKSLYQHFYRSYCIMADDLIHDWEQANDIVQETFIELYSRLQELNSIDKIEVFLMATTQQKCQQYRQEVLEEDRTHEEYLYLSAKNESLVTDGLIEAEVLMATHQEIKKLPPQRKRILNEWLNGLSFEQVAEKMKLSSQTIRNQKSLAIAALKKALSDKKFKWYPWQRQIKVEPFLYLKFTTLATYKHIASLIVKHRNNELTDKERQELDEWCALSEKNRMLFERLNDEAYLSLKRKRLNSIDIDAQWEKISSRLPVKKPHLLRTLFTGWRAAAVAAGIVVCLGGIWFWQNKPPATDTVKSDEPVMQVQSAPADTSAPANNRTILKLADGKPVYLDGKADGQIAKQQNATIYKDGNWMSYSVFDEARAADEQNTIITPKGKNWRVMLPDGSKAWVNTVSSITYPTAFIGKERRIAVSGEVYIEVVQKRTADGGHIPFIVDVLPTAHRGGERVEVMGTRFNINAYDDEPVMATTLLEGKVKVSSTDKGHAGKFPAMILKPGEQAQLNKKGELEKIKGTDTEKMVAWTSDQFDYDEQDIRLIMRDIARWYDCNVVYKDKVTGHCTFKLPRQSALHDVLKVLEDISHMRFTVSGKQIIVTSLQG
jgi:transmembrane sensor